MAEKTEQEMTEQEKEERFEKIFNAVLYIVGAVVAIYIALCFLVYPSTVWKVKMFWSNKYDYYTTMDKVALTAKATLMPFYVASDNETVEKQLDEDLKNYIAYRAKEHSWRIFDDFRGRHFVFDNSFLFEDFEKYLKKFMKKCNSLSAEGTNVEEYNQFAQFCNQEIDAFDDYFKYAKSDCIKFFSCGYLLDPIRKDVENYVPRPIIKEEVKPAPEDASEAETAETEAKAEPVDSAQAVTDSLK